MKLFVAVSALVIIFATAAEAQNWQRLINAETFGLCINPLRSSTVYVGGLGRRLYRSYDAGKTWDTLVVEFTTATTRFTNVYVSPADTNVIMVAGLGFGSVRRSADHGQTWDIVIETLSPFTAPSETILNDPHNPDIVYTADLRYCNIYRSYDRGVTWDTIGSAGIPFDENLCTLAIRRDSSNIIVAGMIGGAIKISADSGKTWKFANQLPISADDSEVSQIVFSKRDPLVGYAAITYFYYLNRPNGGIFRTKDGGYSWERIGFADTSFWTVAARVRNGEDDVFAGGYTEDYGAPLRVPGYGIVKHTTDGGTTWIDAGQNIPWPDSIRRNAWMIKFAGENDELVYMATERGFYLLDESAQSANENTTVEEIITSLADKKLRVSAASQLQISGEITLSSLLGAVVARRRIETNDNSETFDFSELPAGVYIVSVNLGGKRQFGTVVMLD
ncbi:hypothetical protein MASR2M18_03620 [Ignavibacteria bacterium]|nr:T9SS type A sorting domain-containing protein [Bacteroidota bacterium]MCZ2133391.1 T9SS type A sorting domain-containing protein [Bacteroidota bacterium]